MQLIAFDFMDKSILIKTADKYIQMFHDDAGEPHFRDMTCKHRGGPLSHGIEEKGAIKCPWHGQKTKVCKIHYLEIPYVENRKEILLGVENFERLVPNV